MTDCARLHADVTARIRRSSTVEQTRAALRVEFPAAKTEAQRSAEYDVESYSQYVRKYTDALEKAKRTLAAVQTPPKMTRSDLALRRDMATFRVLLRTAYDRLVITSPLDGYGVTKPVIARYTRPASAWYMGVYFLEVRAGKVYTIRNLSLPRFDDLQRYQHPNVYHWENGTGDVCWTHGDETVPGYRRFKDGLSRGAILDGFLWLWEFLNSPPLAYIERQNRDDRSYRKADPKAPFRGWAQVRTAAQRKADEIAAKLAAEQAARTPGPAAGGIVAWTFRAGDRVTLRPDLTAAAYGWGQLTRGYNEPGTVISTQASSRGPAGSYAVVVDFPDQGHWTALSTELVHVLADQHTGETIR